MTSILSRGPCRLTTIKSTLVSIYKAKSTIKESIQKSVKITLKDRDVPADRNQGYLFQCFQGIPLQVLFL